jgi:hypothetical protein
MIVAAPAMANELVGHACKEKSKPRPFGSPQRVGHPKRLNQFLDVDVLEWYHAFVTKDQAQNAQGWAARATASTKFSCPLHDKSYSHHVGFSAAFVWGHMTVTPFFRRWHGTVSRRRDNHRYVVSAILSGLPSSRLWDILPSGHGCP